MGSADPESPIRARSRSTTISQRRKHRSIWQTFRPVSKFSRVFIFADRSARDVERDVFDVPASTHSSAYDNEVQRWAAVAELYRAGIRLVPYRSCSSFVDPTVLGGSHAMRVGWTVDRLIQRGGLSSSNGAPFYFPAAPSNFARSRLNVSLAPGKVMCACS